MSTNPYNTPNVQLPELASDRASGSLGFTLLGIILYTAPIWAWLAIKLQMLKAFEILERGNANAAELAQHIQAAMLTVIGSFAIGVSGAIIILITLFKHKNRQAWFFWTTIFLSVAWCCTFVLIGMIIALPVTVIFLFRTREFFNQPKTQT